MNYYLFSIRNAAITVKNFYPLNERLTINYQADFPHVLQIEDRILLAQQIEQYVLPYEFSIVSINRQDHTMVIKVAAIHQHNLPLAAISLLLTAGKTAQDTVQLTQREVDGILSLMNMQIGGYNLTDPPPPNPPSDTSKVGDPRVEYEPEPDDDTVFEETEVLELIKGHIHNRGYYFEDETLYNYHICLKTRPFVILAGLSGTGKSKLAQLYAEALGQWSHFKRLPVRPNWNDDRYLLGYLNTLTGEYITEPTVEFVLEAMRRPKRLFSLCLDEMNLAHVEYYFSQFLSAMEEEKPEGRRIELLTPRAQQQLQQTDAKQHIPAEIYLPDNMLFTGTINVDETTQPISDKVIDRANTIEFFNVDLDKIPERKDPGVPVSISATAWQSYRAQMPDTSRRAEIVEINRILKKADTGIGYRVVHEMELYLANSKNLLQETVAFDLQVKQRILPRIRGTEVIEGMLNELITFSKNNKLIRTEQRLDEMKRRLERDGYTSFWR